MAENSRPIDKVSSKVQPKGKTLYDVTDAEESVKAVHDDVQPSDNFKFSSNESGHSPSTVTGSLTTYSNSVSVRY